ncbi:L-rhamnose isomerase [Shigella flexneri]
MRCPRMPRRQTALCLDAGISTRLNDFRQDFRPMLYVPQLLLHVGRNGRWDSDHVVLLDDETQAIASEIVRHDLFDQVDLRPISLMPLSTALPRRSLVDAI